MALERVLEPEVMDTAAEASDYNQMDHSEVNTLFVEDLLDFARQHGRKTESVLDLGTGTALIPIELCRRHSTCCVTAIDMAAEMLKLARFNVAEAGFEDRIKLEQVDAKLMPYGDQTFDCCISNSIIHHIPEPESCVREFIRVTNKGGFIFVRDLLRPADGHAVKKLVQIYAGDENEHSRKMFEDSLRAALSLNEIRDLVAIHGFDPESVNATSDRHWTWAAIKEQSRSNFLHS